MPRHTRVVPVGWSAAETEALLERVRAEGNQGFYTYAKTANKSYDACRMYLQRNHREAWLEAMESWRIAQFRNPVTAPKEKGPNRTDEIADWWDTFKPVSLPAPKRPKANVTATTGVTVVASDLHFPLQDDAAVSVLLRTIEELKPERVVLNGDLPDLLAISKYPKDVRQTWSLQDEAVAFHGFRRQPQRGRDREPLVALPLRPHPGVAQDPAGAAGDELPGVVAPGVEPHPDEAGAGYWGGPADYARHVRPAGWRDVGQGPQRELPE